MHGLPFPPELRRNHTHSHTCSHTPAHTNSSSSLTAQDCAQEEDKALLRTVPYFDVKRKVRSTCLSFVRVFIVWCTGACMWKAGTCACLAICSWRACMRA